MSGSEEENRRMMKEEEEEEDKGLVMDDDDDDDDVDLDLDDNFSSDFKNYINKKSTNVNWRRLKPMAAWLFWTEVAVLESESPPITTHSSSSGVPNSVPEIQMATGKVTDKIRSVIQKLITEFERYNFGVLIQLWAPTRDGDRCVLSTADQPFGVCNSKKEFFDFRMKCMNYKFYVDAESVDDPGVLGHAFCQNELAYTPDITYYSKEEYPQRYDARNSNVKTSMAFPVIEPSTWGCVGVLEVLCSISIWCNSYIIKVYNEIQVAGLKSSDAFGHSVACVHNEVHNQVLEEISKGMKVVCETHKLLMGWTWTPCRCCRDVELGGSCSKCYVSCKGQIMTPRTLRQASYALEKDIQRFARSCIGNFIRARHGVSGRALLSYNPCFCKDVTQFRKTEYPLVHLARMFGLTGCFAICLRSSLTGDEDYVMEFFLPPNKNGGRVPRTLYYILATMKQHFPSFKLASGKELGQELSIEVIKISKERKPGDSFQICQITMSAPTLALRDVGDTVQLDSTNQQFTVEANAIDNESNVVGPEQNNGQDVIYSENNARNVALDSVNKQLMVEANAVNNERNVATDSTNQKLMVEVDAITNERNVTMDSTEQQLMVEADAMNNEMNVVGLEQNHGHNVIYSENNSSLRTSTEQETEIENQITRDVLEKLFGMLLDDAAKKLKVSPSTFKRICRQNGIKRWVGSKKKKGNGSLNKLNQPEEPLEQMVIGNEGASHDLRNLSPPPTAAEACPQVSKLELHMAKMSMAPRLEPDAVISTRPDASDRGAFTSVGTTLDSGNLSLAKKARLERNAISNERNAKENMKVIEEVHSRSQNLPQSVFVDGPLFKEDYRTQSVKPISYVNEFPDGLRPFIQHVEDVLADGNCGFRAIAGLLGLGEDNWQQVRSNLIIELHSYVTHYKKLFGSHMIDELTRSLSYSESCVNIDRWMIMPEMGHLIASCYDVVLYHLSMHQCLTFLPLRSIPVLTSKRREICIGFVKGNHFVKVFLLPGHPVPPIANNWIKFHHPCANGWDNTYIFRIEHFRQIVSSNVATKENIDLVTSSSSSGNWRQFLNKSSPKEAPEQSTSST